MQSQYTVGRISRREKGLGQVKKGCPTTKFLTVIYLYQLIKIGNIFAYI